MPVMGGLELTKQVMRLYPMPILVLSVSVREDSTNIFELLKAGAVDVMLKPKGGLESDVEKTAKELITRIKVLSGVRVIPRRILAERAPEIIISKIQIPKPQIIVIGASTGGPQALHEILKGLPADFPLPIICIQHISNGFLRGLLEWLAEQSRIKVRIAEHGELPLPCTVYFPQEGTHLKIDNDGRLLCSTEPPVYGHRPSISVTMRSIAQYYRNSVIAVLLTGMGNDGSEGMLTVKEAGGVTIVQDEESCVVFGMPKQAIELGGAEHILPLSAIGETLIRLGGNKNEF
jgi:two-component system chemotaxis response regulator CheB